MVNGDVPGVATVEVGDVRAFAELFEIQRASALQLAYGMTGDAAVAEDVVAEAFARTFERWAKGGIDDPNAYVRRAVVNEVRTMWRRLAVRHKHANRQRAAEPIVSGDDQIGDAEVLQRALSTLAPRQRAVVLLRIVDDMSEKDVAAVLGLSVGTVKSHLSRGLDRLRAAVDVDGGIFDG